MIGKKNLTSQTGNIDSFIQAVRQTPATVSPSATQGRLIFALDATASRQSTWNMACELQIQMFGAVADIGGLAIQLCFYRGIAECKASRWVTQAQQLQQSMSKVRCRGGHTQIARILKHARSEHANQPVNALAFVGDAMEENPDSLCQLAGELGIRGVPVFIFQEGRDLLASQTFAEMARLSGGAHCAFDQNSAEQLKALLSAVAMYAAGGYRALSDYSKKHPALAKLSSQLQGPRGKEK